MSVEGVIACTNSDLDDRGWQLRLAADAARLVRCIPDDLRDLHDTVVERARAAGALGLILSGSTARGARTEISDLDYHLVGADIERGDLSRELDLHVRSAADLRAEILAGDDFVQWSLRFGCVVFDHGEIRSVLRLVAEERLWPDAERKRKQAAKSIALARRFVDTGDLDGALVQVRTALSLAARAVLLGMNVFPLSRAELPGQLREAGHVDAARALALLIYDSPTLEQLAAAVVEGEKLSVRDSQLTVRGARVRT